MGTPRRGIAPSSAERKLLLPQHHRRRCGTCQCKLACCASHLRALRASRAHVLTGSVARGTKMTRCLSPVPREIKRLEARVGLTPSATKVHLPLQAQKFLQFALICFLRRASVFDLRALGALESVL
jgi:hypothetical protein